MKSCKVTLERFDSDLWYFHVKVPREISSYFLSNDNKRLICQIDGQVTIHCALMPVGDGQYFININKEIRKKLKWEVGESKLIELVEDESKYGMEMPLELEEVLASDAEGDRVFHELTAGKQRNLIYIAGKPKTTATRIKKSIIMIDYLKSVNGQLDFKELNQAFKDRKNDF